MQSLYLEKLEKLENFNLNTLQDTALSCLPEHLQKAPWNVCNLERGTAIYQDEIQLNAYLAAYCSMHKEKLNKLFENIPTTIYNQKFNIIDWGCGQGVATLTFIEYLKKFNIPLTNIKQIILIEPSELAFERAKIHIKYFYPDADIIAFNCDFDSFKKENLSINNTHTVLHLFSNVLDLKNINLTNIIYTVCSLSNKSYLLITSPYYIRAITQIENFVLYLNKKEILYEFNKIGKEKNNKNDYTCCSKIIELFTSEENEISINYNDALIKKNEIINKIYTYFENIANDKMYFRLPFLNGYTTDLMIISPNRGAILFNISFAENEKEAVQDFYAMLETKKAVYEMNTKLFNDNYNKVSLYLCFVNFSMNQVNKVKIEINKHDRKLADKLKYIKFFIETDLSDKFCKNIYNNNVNKQNDSSLTREIYNEFSNSLLLNYHRAEEGKSYYLSEQQKSLCVSKPGGQKIKGVAGSGKTLVLLYRAINAFERTGSPVLILTFNLTLCNSLREKLDTIPKDFDKNFLKIISFHRFIRAVYDLKLSQFDTDKTMEDSLKKGFLFDLDEELYKNFSDVFIKYSTILIDEGQDYENKWLTILYKYFTKPNFEFVIFADEKQNVYSIEFDNNKMPKTPIPGAWNKSLSAMYRNTANLNELLQNMQKTFFDLGKTYNYDKIERVQGSLFDHELKFYYSSFETIDYQELTKFILEELEKRKLDYSDCVILSPFIDPLVEIYEILTDKYYIDTNIIFATKKEKQEVLSKISSQAASPNDLSKNDKEKYDARCHAIERYKKIHFNMNNKLSLCTIHSFKGWEAKVVFLLLYVPKKINFQSKAEEEYSAIKPEVVYTGLSRAKEFCFIINTNDNEYDDFFFDNREVEYLKH